jgi:hypothetical protein
MTTTEILVLVPVYTGAAVTIIGAIAAAFRHQKQEQRADVAHTDLVTRSNQVVATLTDVKTQTNGNTQALLSALTDALVKIGKLEGMLQMQIARSGGRATDPVVLLPSAPPELPATTGPTVLS